MELNRYFSVNVFEQPWLWVAIGLWVEMGLFIAGRRWPEKIKRKHLLIGPIVVGLALGADWLITTDREKIEEVVAAVAKATEKEDAEGIIEQIGAGYRGRLGQSREEFAVYCRVIFSQPQIEDNYVLGWELSLEGRQAVVKITTLSLLDIRSEWAYLKSAKAVWEVRLEKQADKSWRIVWVDLLEFNGEKIDWNLLNSSGGIAG